MINNQKLTQFCKPFYTNNKQYSNSNSFFVPATSTVLSLTVSTKTVPGTKKKLVILESRVVRGLYSKASHPTYLTSKPVDFNYISHNRSVSVHSKTNKVYQLKLNSCVGFTRFS